MPDILIQNAMHHAMMKALRAKNGLDLYRPMKRTMEFLHREPESMRIRDARPGEKTLWDGVAHEDTMHMHWTVD